MKALRREEIIMQEKKDALLPKWYAIYTHPRAEKQVFQRLLEQGIEAYLPLQKTLRQWSDRKKMVEVPLFTSYVFVRINRRSYDDVLRTNGVVKYVMFEGKAATIPNEQIDNLKIIVNSNENIETDWKRLEKGERVRVTAGSLRGLTGELITDGKRKKVLVRIDRIDQNLVVEVHGALLEAIGRRQ